MFDSRPRRGGGGGGAVDGEPAPILPYDEARRPVWLELELGGDDKESVTPDRSSPEGGGMLMRLRSTDADEATERVDGPGLGG